jgi:signal transduction histidine kinase
VTGVRKDGTEIPLELAISEMWLGDSRLFIGALRDLTERKHVQRALREARERIEEAIESISEGFVIFDAEDRLVQYNSKYREMFAGAADVLDSKPTFEEWARVCAERGLVKVAADREEASVADRIKQHREGVGPTEHQLREGRWLRVTEYRTKSGGTAGLRVDITEQRRAEEQLRQAQKMEAVGQLTGGVAHDFNNLLAVVMGNAELARDRLPDDDPLNAYLDSVMKAAKSGAELTQQLLAFSRIQTLRPRILDPNILIGGMITFLRRTLGKSIRIDTKRGADLGQVDADPAQLENAILNLAINARDAMPDGGTLTIETGAVELVDGRALDNTDLEAGPYVTLAVVYSGTGMYPEIVHRVFDPFFTTKDVGEGTGLGLSMVYGFVGQSGGHVEIESKVGRSTTVRLYLPKALEGGDIAGRAVEDGTEIRGAGEAVLVVEDDDAVRELALRVLESLGYRPIGAADGEAGLRALEQRSDLSLLLSDVVLPGGMNGPDLAAVARQRRPGLKVLFMSGYVEIAGTDADRLIGEDELVRKPFRKSELGEKMRAILDG